MSTNSDFLEIIKKNNPKANLDMVKLAYEYAKEAHKGQKRMSGEPYINHSLDTAFTLAKIKTDMPTIIAGLLHDVPEDTKITLNDIKKNFGSEVASLVKGITKLSKVKYRGIDRYVENLKKMFIAAAQDSRVMIIKFADRLHNLKTLKYLPKHKQKRIVEETFKIYAPIAGLLGVWHLRWQLEDLCFEFLDPENFNKIKEKYEREQQKEREILIKKISENIAKEAKKYGIKFIIEGRFKHIYSVWLKMQNKNKKFNEIYDVFAMRIIVDSIPDCYKMLGAIHTLYHPKKYRFKDFISMPKPNGYRSLHTTVFGHKGKLIEFQIRTQQMHEEALYGVAAHWRYKDAISAKSTWIDDILKIQKNSSNNKDFIKTLEFNIFSDRIFVFTPRGDVIDLPKMASAVDFAYHVHSEIGNRCAGAIINEKIESLETTLKSGDLVEIIIDKNRKGPNIDWLKFVKTQSAREHIRRHAKKQGILSSIMSRIKQ
ncbi:bifunctional (p)ppGpp synthetase/guanosine-3',5'-bis(diphosphate) 3'-pyrophosphohydrolase [Candidatus Parcubacteria bacterium]|nr:bifunctional (p)ppGpp synthetase/guanosine-3',5'-bis(diphosphate) 3'-pyrophosphohydrolase [Candidatus Parcubacteria bacterium]